MGFQAERTRFQGVADPSAQPSSICSSSSYVDLSTEESRGYNKKMSKPRQIHTRSNVKNATYPIKKDKTCKSHVISCDYLITNPRVHLHANSFRYYEELDDELAERKGSRIACPLGYRGITSSGRTARL